jgi:hypothetical protein
MDLVEKIKANAGLVIQQFPEQNLGYNEESVEWLDGFIERQRERLDDKQKNGLSQTLGCFLGECIRLNYGGEWEKDENGLAVVFSDGNSCYPLNKVEKQFAYGSGDSVLSFYQMIQLIFIDKQISENVNNAF